MKSSQSNQDGNAFPFYNLRNLTNDIPSVLNWGMFDLNSFFDDISIFMGYLMPKPSLQKKGASMIQPIAEGKKNLYLPQGHLSKSECNSATKIWTCLICQCCMLTPMQQGLAPNEGEICKIKYFEFEINLTLAQLSRVVEYVGIRKGKKNAQK